MCGRWCNMYTILYQYAVRYITVNLIYDIEPINVCSVCFFQGNDKYKYDEYKAQNKFGHNSTAFCIHGLSNTM